MLIDTHCHIDQFPSPESVVRECEESQIRVVAVTNLPTHFAIAADRLKGHALVSPALGMHPLSSNRASAELTAFKRMAPHANFIGEVGLDFSRQGAASKCLQERIFEEVLRAIGERPRFITLHSRGAEQAVLEALRRNHIRGGVFHWFSGPIKILNQALDDGHFASINPAMVSSARGQQIIAQAPRDRILVESDGPFAKVNGVPCRPTNIEIVYRALCDHWKTSFQETTAIVKANFSQITEQITNNSKLRCES